jgi:hypothetical protein
VSIQDSVDPSKRTYLEPLTQIVGGVALRCTQLLGKLLSTNCRCHGTFHRAPVVFQYLIIRLRVSIRLIRASDSTNGSKGEAFVRTRDVSKQTCTFCNISKLEINVVYLSLPCAVYNLSEYVESAQVVLACMLALTSTSSILNTTQTVHKMHKLYIGLEKQENEAKRSRR